MAKRNSSLNTTAAITAEQQQDNGSSDKPWKYFLNDKPVSKQEHDAAVAEHIQWLQQQENKRAEELGLDAHPKKRRSKTRSDS